MRTTHSCTPIRTSRTALTPARLTRSNTYVNTRAHTISHSDTHAQHAQTLWDTDHHSQAWGHGEEGVSSRKRKVGWGPQTPRTGLPPPAAAPPGGSCLPASLLLALQGLAPTSGAQ